MAWKDEIIDELKEAIRVAEENPLDYCPMYRNYKKSVLEVAQNNGSLKSISADYAACQNCEGANLNCQIYKDFLKQREYLI